MKKRTLFFAFIALSIFTFSQGTLKARWANFVLSTKMVMYHVQESEDSDNPKICVHKELDIILRDSVGQMDQYGNLLPDESGKISFMYYVPKHGKSLIVQSFPDSVPTKFDQYGNPIYNQFGKIDYTHVLVKQFIDVSEMYEIGPHLFSDIVQYLFVYKFKDFEALRESMKVAMEQFIWQKIIVVDENSIAKMYTIYDKTEQKTIYDDILKNIEEGKIKHLIIDEVDGQEFKLKLEF